MLHLDQCGSHPPRNRTTDADVELVKEHIRSFPLTILGQIIHTENIFHQNYLLRRCTFSTFYKRQSWVYNLGVHDCASDQAYMYT